MSKQLRLDVAQLTDVGLKRPHNEDNMAYVIPKDALLMARKGALFIVADGMGGHAAGEVASEIAVDAVTSAYYQDDSEDIAISLLHAIKRANALIHQRAAENMLRSGMGTTCVAAVLRGNMAYVANVGDSRAYLTRGGQMKQVSQDHSWVEEQVRAGLLTRDQARSHAQRNVITRCLGTQSDVEVDVFSEELEEGDTLVLCSDGLSGLVGDDELRAIVDQYVPQESVYRLVERARENGGPDNITAIVMRVQEVGWDPPYARHPAYVGGSSEPGEDTAMLGRISGPMMMPAPMENNRVPSAPLSLTGSPFLASDNLTSQRSALAPSRRKPHRLLYSIIIMLVLLVALAGGAAYYFLRPTVDVDRSLMDASTLVSQANAEVTNNPADALSLLSRAQTKLQDALNGSPTDTQRTSINNLLDGNFTKVVRTAITNYNQQSAITMLPCSNTLANPINSGQTGTQASSIVALQDGKGNTFLYTLSDNHGLYQIDDHHNLTNQFKGFPSNVQPIVIAGNTTNQNQYLVVLTTSPGKDAETLNYTLRLLKLDGATLRDINDSSIDASFIKDSHNQPKLMAVWGTDVYVVISSDVALNQATILDFPTSGDKFQSGSPRSTTISVSSNILSIAAFPKNQLFLLDGSGSLQSLQLNGGNPLPVPLGVTHSIATPLAISAKDFTSNKPVPTPGQSSSHFLAIPGAKLLTTTTVNGIPHLYIVDDEAYHRVLDLIVAPDSLSHTATVVPSPTPTLVTSGTGGGLANSGPLINMELLQQYTSASLLTSVKSVAADPKALLYLLTQSGQNNLPVNLVSIDVSQNSACAS